MIINSRGVQTQLKPVGPKNLPDPHPNSTRTDAHVGRWWVFTPNTQRRWVEWQFSSLKPESPNPPDDIYKARQLRQDQAQIWEDPTR